MSEINSIANGTYTIGSTSATNFVAGPGIKIDSPSAGTVRIGNDETVLWSGEVNATTATANLSEPVSSFKRVKMLCKLNRSTPVAAQWFEFNTDVEYYTMLGGLTNANTTAGKAYMGEAMVSLSGGIIDYYNGKQLEWGSTAVSNSKNASIYQVVGINRISGSNA